MAAKALPDFVLLIRYLFPPSFLIPLLTKSFVKLCAIFFHDMFLYRQAVVFCLSAVLRTRIGGGRRLPGIDAGQVRQADYVVQGSGNPGVHLDHLRQLADVFPFDDKAQIGFLVGHDVVQRIQIGLVLLPQRFRKRQQFLAVGFVHRQGRPGHHLARLDHLLQLVICQGIVGALGQGDGNAVTLLPILS